jgi:caa(3)-type oxidase subunit IV
LSEHGFQYVKIWAVLLVLLVVSVAGPMIGIRWLTLVTAFGIAFVKAFIVATRFMHINMERKFVTYMLGGMLAFMLVMVAGISPDVLKHDGPHWENVAAKASVARGEKEGAAHAGEHEGAAEHGAEKHDAAPAEHH